MQQHVLGHGGQMRINKKTMGKMVDIDSLWHRGDEEPKWKAWVVMINTTGKYLGRYENGCVKVEAGPFCVGYALTPKCRWAYLKELRGQRID